MCCFPCSMANEEESWEGSENSEETEEEYQTKQRILAASLPYVHQHGWTHKAIAAGIRREWQMKCL